MKVLIIGGVAAGTKVAAKLKRENRANEVLILTKSKEISYAGCGLPYYVGHVIEDPGQLIVNTPEKFCALTGAQVETETEVTSINRESKTVEALHLTTGETQTYSYDKLVIASGASPILPPIEGTDLKNVFFMRTPEDAFALRDAIDGGSVKRAVVVGAGFIGLEVAENLAAQGIRVSVLDMAPQILPGFDPEIAEYVENHLAEHNVMCFTNTRLEGILGTEKVEKVQTGKRAMKADLVVLSIGIRPNTSFLSDTGIELMPNKTVKTNKYLQTNDPDIYALGDCASVTNAITGAPAWSPMGSSANMEGRLAASTINGSALPYRGVVQTGVAKLPELNVGRTGLSEVSAKEAGYDAITVTAVLDDKAHYYPDFSNFIIKLIADRATGKFLGLQVLGKGAVDKIVDIGVTALYLNASVDQLANMDLAYAPPFSTAIHPFCHAINILQNKLDQKLESFTPAEYAGGAADDYTVIDTSQAPSIEGAAFIDLTKVNGVIPEYPVDAKLLLVCTRGKRAYLLQNRMKFYGYTNTKVLEGGTTFNTIEIQQTN